MFEKESIIWATKELGNGYVDDIDNHSKTWQRGAEFGYKKCKEVSNKIIQSLLTIIYTESRTDIYTDEISDAEKFLELMNLSENGR